MTAHAFELGEPEIDYDKTTRIYHVCWHITSTVFPLGGPRVSVHQIPNIVWENECDRALFIIGLKDQIGAELLEEFPNDT